MAPGRGAAVAKALNVPARVTAFIGAITVALGACFPSEAQDRFRSHSLVSHELSERHEVEVALPSGYETSTVAYPVLYLLDGRSNLDHTVDAADYLAAHTRIPDMIVVAVHNVNRERDMTPPWMTDLPPLMGEEPRGDRFLAFFEDELIPFVDREYRTQPLRLLVGHSHGGLFAAYAFAARPGLFRWHLVLDAPMHLDDRSLAEKVVSVAATSPDMTKRLVSVEVQFGWPDRSWQDLEAAAPPGLETARLQDLNETHESMPFLGTYLGLKELFFDYPASGNRAMTLEALETQYLEVSGAYGYPVVIPRREMLRQARALLASRRGSQAGEVLDQAARMYGASPEIERLADEAAEVVRTGDVTSNEVVDALLASPRLRAVEAAPLLGTWLGTAEHKGGTPMDLEVTFRVQADTVVGRTTVSINNRSMGDGMPHAFVRLDPDGEAFEWGYPNPRGGGGMVVYSVTMQENGELRGVQGIRGFEMELPEGFVMPVTHVVLRRKATPPS